MELKDVILSTLAEMEDVPAVKQTTDVKVQEKKEPIKKPQELKKTTIQESKSEETISSHESEMMYLNSIRERLLVLFEGFQAPNNTNIEAKVDMTLNFLEYVLATIDSRVEVLEKGNRK